MNSFTKTPFVNVTIGILFLNLANSFISLYILLYICIHIWQLERGEPEASRILLLSHMAEHRDTQNEHAL